jgi:hypothetical protein
MPKKQTCVTMFCCLQDLGSVPYIVPLMDLGKLTLRVLQTKNTKKSIFFVKVKVSFFLARKI